MDPAITSAQPKNPLLFELENAFLNLETLGSQVALLEHICYSKYLSRESFSVLSRTGKFLPVPRDIRQTADTDRDPTIDAQPGIGSVLSFTIYRISDLRKHLSSPQVASSEITESPSSVQSD